MIYLFIFTLGIILYAIDNEDIKIIGGLITWCMIALYIITIPFVLSIPASYHAQYISLQAQHKYIESLPAIPVNGSLIDLPNMKIAQTIVDKKIGYWNAAGSYNSGIYLWRHHKIDFLVWGYPRIRQEIIKLPMIEEK